MNNSRQQFEQEALLKVFELQEEITRLRAIIAAPGVCKNCGDSDPFRQAKWGLSTADEFQDAANEIDRLRAENAGLRGTCEAIAEEVVEFLNVPATSGVPLEPSLQSAVRNKLESLRAENAALAKQLSAAEAKLRAVRERVEPFMQTPVTIQLVGNRVETSPLGEALLAIHELSNQLTKEQA
jgi:hypothetical protein